MSLSDILIISTRYISFENRYVLHISDGVAKLICILQVLNKKSKHFLKSFLKVYQRDFKGDASNFELNKYNYFELCVSLN